ncbi:histidine triad nucleotide-binding protein [Bdellovibrionota bacterium]
MADCLFCKILKGEIPSERVYEDEKVIAFKDIHPKAPVHILVIPREHVGSVAELSESDANVLPSLFLAAQKIAEQLNVKESGYRAVFNIGADAGMEVPHLHLHILGGGRLGGMG